MCLCQSKSSTRSVQLGLVLILNCFDALTWLWLVGRISRYQESLACVSLRLSMCPDVVMIIVNVNCPASSCIEACCYLLGGDSGQCAPGVASYMYRICLSRNSADTSLITHEISKLICLQASCVKFHCCMMCHKQQAAILTVYTSSRSHVFNDWS